jgi:hypothetical protein
MIQSTVNEHEARDRSMEMVDQTHRDAVTSLMPSVSNALFGTVVILTPLGALTWAAIGVGLYRLLA